jgi:hypothetical protein
MSTCQDSRETQSATGTTKLARAKPVRVQRKGGIERVSLDEELAHHERLDRLIGAFEEVDLIEETYEQWEDRQPVLRLIWGKGRLRVRLHFNLATKKTLALISGVVAGLWAIISFLATNWPTIQKLLQNAGRLGPASP